MQELQPQDPRQIGPYRLRARLGAGGMGRVYLGLSAGGRAVAVKVVRPELGSDPEFRARFRQEVAVAQRVSGLFTAPVIDADPDAPTPWLVTDYVHGPSLGEAVAKHGALPLPALLTLAARLAEGLGAVHAAGVVHRDLKPANVLLAEDGPRLIDFGISQAADFVQITSPTSVLGTPGFIAPELVQGEPVGPSSDIFTLGAVLAYAATGELPFGAGPADARTLRVLYLAPDLDKVPSAVRPLLQRCLAKEPGERPTAGEFLADLVAACPDAASDRADWLPADILAEIRQRPLPEETETSRLRVTVPSSATGLAPAGSSRRMPWTRRRVWTAGLTTAVAALAAVIGILAAPSGHQAALAGNPSGHPTAPAAHPAASSGHPTASARPVTELALPAPTGLFAVQTTATAVTLGWNAYTSQVPDQIEILENGKEIASVSGIETNYEITGLSEGVAYHFSTVSVTGGHRSRPSPSYTVINGNIAPQMPLNFADASFNYADNVRLKETYGSDDYWSEKPGSTWQDFWSIGSLCGNASCDASFDGALDGISFSTTLHRSGAIYTASVPMNKYFVCGVSGNYQKSTVNIRLSVTNAYDDGGQWVLVSFSGTLTWNVSYDPSPGCTASLYQMTVSST